MSIQAFTKLATSIAAAGSCLMRLDARWENHGRANISARNIDARLLKQAGGSLGIRARLRGVRGSDLAWRLDARWQKRRKPDARRRRLLSLRLCCLWLVDV